VGKEVADQRNRPRRLLIEAKKFVDQQMERRVFDSSYRRRDLRRTAPMERQPEDNRYILGDSSKITGPAKLKADAVIRRKFKRRDLAYQIGSNEKLISHNNPHKGNV
jgi:hypothetical protein